MSQTVLDARRVETDVAAPDTPGHWTRRVARAAARLIATACLLAAVAGFVGLAIGPHVLGYRTTTMLSGSMNPHIRPGDVLVDVAEPVSQVRVGQVLTIQTPTPTHYVDSHRVVAVIRHAGHTYVRTQGDANSAPDPWLAELHGATVWRVRAVIPHLGQVIIALRSPLAHLLLVWLALPLLVLTGVGEIWRRPRPVEGRSMTSRRRLPARLAGVSAGLLAAFLAVVALAPGASAAFTTGPTATVAVSSVTIAPPDGVTALADCLPPATLTVSWAAPPGPTPTGYVISVSKNGSSSTRVKTVSGRATSTSLSISKWTAYTVLIQTQYGSWTSAASSPSNGVICLI